VLFLKAGRLSGTTWQQYATANGFGAVQIEELLVELSAGATTVFVDGLDRVEVPQRGITQDVINTALQSALLPTSHACSANVVRIAQRRRTQRLRLPQPGGQVADMVPRLPTPSWWRGRTERVGCRVDGGKPST
jgi:hypothetical protein